MSAGKMNVWVAQASDPPGTNWDETGPTWVSLTTVRLDGGLFVSKPTVPVEALFRETWEEPMPHVIDLDGTLFVVSGEITVVRAILDGKPGFEAKVVRG